MSSVPMEFPIDYVENGDGTMKPIYKDASSRLRVYFRKNRQIDTFETLRTGKETYKENILLYKKVKGSTNIPVSRATEEDKRKYPREWEAFKRGESNEESGLLSELYGIRLNDLQYLRSVDINTIQELADAPAGLLDSLDGGEDLRGLANIWLKTREKEKENSNAILVVETYKKKTEELESEVEKLRKELEAAKTNGKAKIKKVA